jgi:hypothetical protein
LFGDTKELEFSDGMMLGPWDVTQRMIRLHAIRNKSRPRLLLLSRLEICFAYEFDDAITLGLHGFGSIRGRGIARFGALRRELSLKVRHGQRAAHFGVKLRDNIGRRACGRKDTLP